jgi:hypothetical protein
MIGWNLNGTVSLCEIPPITDVFSGWKSTSVFWVGFISPRFELRKEMEYIGGVLEQSTGARNRVEKRFLYRPRRLFKIFKGAQD